MLGVVWLTSCSTPSSNNAAPAAGLASGTGATAPAMGTANGGSGAVSATGTAGTKMVASTAGAGGGSTQHMLPTTTTGGASGMASAVATAGSTAAAGSGGAAASAASAGSAAPPVSCDAATLKPGETTETVMVGSVQRSYILHVPSNYTGKSPVPLVVDWHPITGTPEFERGNSGYLALSDKEGFIIAYPTGIDKAWNLGPCCTQSRDVDDLGFSTALVAAIKSKGCVDPKRVYSVGYSMGGGMSLYIACNQADTYASIAQAAFDMFNETEEPCHPTRSIAIMSTRGTGDPIVPYAGGASMPPTGLQVTVHFLGAKANFEKWAELDGCMGMPTDSGQNCQTYTQCKDGVEVVLCTEPGGGHVTGDANAGWEFLQKHPMP